MPTHDFKDIGDVLAFDVLKGTIASIDSANDTCMVSVGGTILDALLFYHCKPDSVMRDNGAIEGAAAGFSVGDEVIVLKRYDNTSIKVIGHVGGIRRCGANFYFLLTCHGAVITPSDNYVYFGIYDSTNEFIGYYVRSYGAEFFWGITVIYDSETQYWHISIDDKETYDPIGYFVEYESTYGIYTQYPHKYKIVDMGQIADLIQPGTYTDNLPYFAYTVTYSKNASQADYDVGTWYRYMNGDPLTVTVQVDTDTNIPYSITSSCYCQRRSVYPAYNTLASYGPQVHPGSPWGLYPRPGTCEYVDHTGASHQIGGGDTFDTIVAVTTNCIGSGSYGITLTDTSPDSITLENGTTFPLLYTQISCSVSIHAHIDN